jgi:hypothetical protein
MVISVKCAHPIMPWIWFIVTGTLSLVGVLWIVTGQRTAPIEAVLHWLSVAPIDQPVHYGARAFSLGLPMAWQTALSFIIAGCVGLSHAYLPKYRLLAMVLLVAVWLRLLVWRIADALIAPDYALVTTLSLAFLLFETLSMLTAMAWMVRHNQVSLPKLPPVLHRAPEAGAPVHVVVLVERQPVYQINHSIASVQGLNWPNIHITVLDVDKRLDVSALCKKHQVDYLACHNPSAPHDGLNSLLPLLPQPYILLLEAGDLLAPNSLMAAMPCMQPDQVSFVQLARAYTHVDVLQRNLKLDKHTNAPYIEDQWLGQVADANAGMVPCLGSGTLFAKRHLEQTGGFAPDWLTTGLRLQKGAARQAVYRVDAPVLTHTPNNFGDWLAQRMQRQYRRYRALALAINPVSPADTLEKRVQLACYGLQALGPWLLWGYWIIPVVSLVTGAPVLPTSLGEVAVYYVPFLLALHFTYPLLTRHLTQRLFADLYHAADGLLPALPLPAALFNKYRETTYLRWHWAYAPLLLAGLTVLALFVALGRLFHTGVNGLNVALMPMLWAFYNLVLLGGVSLIARERRETRLMPRLSTPLRAALYLADNTVAIGRVANLSESGLEVQFDQPVPTLGAQQLQLLEHGPGTPLTVEAVHSVIETHGDHYVGFRVIRRPDSQRYQLIKHLSYATSPTVVRTHMAPMWGLLGTLPFWLQAKPEIANRRRTPRFVMHLSCVIEHKGDYMVCFSHTISEQGMAVLLKTGHTLKVGDTVKVRIQWPDAAISTLHGRILNQLPNMENDLLSITFEGVTPDLAQTLVRQLYRPSQHIVRTAPVVNRQLNGTLDGQRMRTLGVSEKGIICQLANISGLTEGTVLPVQLQWHDDEPPAHYAMQLVSLHLADKQAMLYFTEQALADVQVISQHLSHLTAGQANRVPPFLQGPAVGVSA